MSGDPASPPARRSIAWWWVFPIVAGLIAGTILVALFLPHPAPADLSSPRGFYATIRGLVSGGMAPVLVALGLASIVITLLGLWPRVVRDSVPTRRWVLAVPVLYTVPCLIFADYGALAEKGAAFFATTVAYVLLIAISEELTYRGLALEMLRDGLAEPWAAVLATLLFAISHVINGAGSLPTIISAFIGGYLYYVIRRSTVFIVFPILAHAAFDLFGFSHWAGGDAGFNMFVYQCVLFIAVVALSRLIRPKAAERAEEGAPDLPPV